MLPTCLIDSSYQILGRPFGDFNKYTLNLKILFGCSGFNGIEWTICWSQ